MITYFNRKDLVKFGEYLLSDERTKRISETETEYPSEERLKKVHHADIENFKNRSK